jgi:hypothetical protein
LYYQVNTEIWWKLRPFTKSRDLKMQKLETTLLKSIIYLCLRQLTEQLLNAIGKSESVDNSEIKELLQLSMTIVSHAVKEVHFLRGTLKSQISMISISSFAVTKRH